MKQLYLGIDVGTTHLKVCAVDAQGSCLSVAEQDQELISNSQRSEEAGKNIKHTPG